MKRFNRSHAGGTPDSPGQGRSPEADAPGTGAPETQAPERRGPEARAPEPALSRLADAELRTVIERAPIGVARVSLDGSVTAANDSLGSLLGCEPTSLVGKRMKELTHAEDVESVEDAVSRVATGAVPTHRSEVRLVSTEGDPIWVELHVVPVAFERTVDHLIAYVIGVADRRRFEEQLRHVATHDAVTGLRNRRGFEEELDRHEDRAARFGTAGSLLVIDVDNFSEAIEQRGYAAGDALLMSVAEVIRSESRSTDITARLGGDDFAVLLPHADGSEAMELAGRIVDSVKSRETQAGEGQPLAVTVSVGVAVFDDSLPGGEAVLAFADDAARQAKHAGGSRVFLYDANAAHPQTGRSRLEWVDKIRHAVEEDNFLIYAQPVLDLRSERICRYELYIRMLDGDQIVSPAEFLHVAERHGLAKEIDIYVANRALDLLSSDTYPAALQVEINLSPTSLVGGELLQLLERRFAESGVEPQRLVFEVTEPAAAASLALVREFAEKVAALGCQFALDDFGTGFGNFAYLKHLPFDYVKIDREFVEGLMTSATDRLIIESTVAIAEGLGKQTVAEFVGDLHTLHFLQRLGVDYAQGYHVGRPAPLTDLLERWESSVDNEGGADVAGLRAGDSLPS